MVKKCKKTRFSHTKEYNKVYWDMMNSKKAWKGVDGKQSPQLKNFFKGIYEKKRKKLKKEFCE